MKVLLTGATGYVGSALAPRLRARGHHVRGVSRDAARITAEVDEAVTGDVVTGAGIAAALEGVDAAYYLVHSMEPGAAEPFPARERRAAEGFAAAARAAGVRRVIYLGGLVPADPDDISQHLRSRLAVEEALLAGVEEAIALRASLVVGAGSRSFRFLVRLIERSPVLPLPSWRDNRTQVVDGRDVLEVLLRALTAPARLAGRSYDLAGPDLMTYGEMVTRIADLMLLDRPRLALDLALTPIASAVAAAIAGEDRELILPLMESLEHELLPRPGHDAAAAFGVRLHSFDAAVERALREWERDEELAGR